MWPELEKRTTIIADVAQFVRLFLLACLFVRSLARSTLAGAVVAVGLFSWLPMEQKMDTQEAAAATRAELLIDV